MAEGPLGLDRPFVEEPQQSQLIIYEFEDRFSKRDLRNKGQVLVGKIQNEGIGVADIKVDNGTDNSITVKLLSTNLSIQEIEEMRDIGLRTDGYRNMVVSTVPPEQIRRL